MANEESTSDEAWSLGLKDLAALLDGFLDEISKEGTATLKKVLVEMIVEDGRFDKQIATLRAMTAVAGSNFLGDGLLVHRELERLLAADGWTHPAEVLDADPGDIVYSQLIRVAAARAEESGDPDPILAVKRRLEKAKTSYEGESELFESLIVHLLDLDPEAAKDRLDRLTAHYSFRRQQPDWKPGTGQGD